MCKPLVSVCIPVYNAVNYIQITIDCFLNQTYKNIEIIVQDDCSTDGTWELINKLYSFNYQVKLFQNKSNLGIGLNWNNAYEGCTGNYIVIANGDDIFLPFFIEQAVNLITAKQSDAVTFYYERLIELTQEKKRNFGIFPRESGIINDATKQIYFYNPYHIIFTLFSKESLDKIAKNRGKLFLNTQVCDFELLFKYSISNNIYFCNEIAGYYRIYSTNNSSKPLAEDKSFYFYVFPRIIHELRHILGNKYKVKIRKDCLNYIKEVIKLRKPLNFKLLLVMFKYSI